MMLDISLAAVSSSQIGVFTYNTQVCTFSEEGAFFMF